MLLTTQLLFCALAPVSDETALAPDANSAPTRPTPPALVSRGPSLHWGDFDRDGTLDAFVATPRGADRLLRGEAGELVDVTRRSGLETSVGSRIAIWLDYDGDGDPDLLTASDRAPSRLWSNDGSGLFVDVTREAGLARELPDLTLAAFDFDGDGRVDVQRRTARGDHLFRNVGEGLFEEVELPVLRDASGTTSATAAATDRAPVRPPSPGSGLSGGSSSSTTNPGTSTTTGMGSQQPVGTTQNCPPSLDDMANPGTCVPLSSAPMLGAIYPLGVEFNIDGAGQIGVGTTTPGAQVDVVGDVRASGQLISTEAVAAPLSVASTTKVDSLNADLLDGFEAADFSQLGSSISGSELDSNAVQSIHIFPDTISSVDIASGGVLSDEIQDGTILDVDVNPLAGIAGTKIAASFGTQTVTSDGTTGAPAMRGEGVNGPTGGYLGVQGVDDFDGITNADWAGEEIGVAGISYGASFTDNYGVVGHASHVGVRGFGLTYGVQGASSDDTGVGVYGSNDSTNGFAYGVMGELPTATSTGTAVRGVAPFYGVMGETTDNGVGVLGITGNTGVGVYGRGETGILGDSQVSSGYSRGVIGYSQSSSGQAVTGVAQSSTGVTYGVNGESQSNSGRGVYGYASASSGVTYGLFGQTESTSGRGVRGESLATTGTNYGVQGRVHSTSGWGVISYGASGTTGQKNFIQPHPEDPGLELHFFSLEGNESGTYFRGSGEIVGGSATIEVPEEFRLASAADGLTVQVTAVGAPAMLWVESRDLHSVVIRGTNDVRFDYTVNGLRRGFEEVEVMAANHNFVPEVAGVPFGTQYPESYRHILVENGILNADFTPNLATAQAQGWQLREQQLEVIEHEDSPALKRARGLEAGRQSPERELSGNDD